MEENLPSNEELKNEYEPSIHSDVSKNNLKNQNSLDNISEIDDPLDQCPPDFKQCWKHRDANKVKNLDQRNAVAKDISNYEYYCQ
mmetsp:Transcript_19104/g.22019  ORF Transcript_19104/g.22019 Transcript_19104/m.22019 type:complete len:85 (+) Transcript_19104:1-255(+)